MKWATAAMTLGIMTIAFVSIVLGQDKGIWTATPLSYPQMAWIAQIQGDVRFDLEIDPSGRIVSIAKQSGSDLLATDASKGIKEWRYTSTAQSWHATVSIHYSLHKPLSYQRFSRMEIRTPFDISVSCNYPAPEGNPETLKPLKP